MRYLMSSAGLDKLDMSFVCIWVSSPLHRHQQWRSPILMFQGGTPYPNFPWGQHSSWGVSQENLVGVTGNLTLARVSQCKVIFCLSPTPIQCVLWTSLVWSTPNLGLCMDQGVLQLSPVSPHSFLLLWSPADAIAMPNPAHPGPSPLVCRWVLQSCLA